MPQYVVCPSICLSVCLLNIGLAIISIIIIIIIIVVVVVLVVIVNNSNTCVAADTNPLEVLVDRASKRLYEMLVIGEHVTLKVTSHGTLYVFH